MGAVRMIVGLIASLLVSGRRRMDLLTTTTALGVVGAVAGGFVHWYLLAPSGEPFSLSGDAWQGWIAAILVAAMAVWSSESCTLGSYGSDRAGESHR